MLLPQPNHLSNYNHQRTGRFERLMDLIFSKAGGFKLSAKTKWEEAQVKKQEYKRKLKSWIRREAHYKRSYDRRYPVIPARELDALALRREVALKRKPQPQVSDLVYPDSRIPRYSYNDSPSTSFRPYEYQVNGLHNYDSTNISSRRSIDIAKRYGNQDPILTDFIEREIQRARKFKQTPQRYPLVDICASLAIETQKPTRLKLIRVPDNGPRLTPRESNPWNGSTINTTSELDGVTKRVKSPISTENQLPLSVFTPIATTETVATEISIECGYTEVYNVTAEIKAAVKMEVAAETKGLNHELKIEAKREVEVEQKILEQEEYFPSEVLVQSDLKEIQDGPAEIGFPAEAKEATPAAENKILEPENVTTTVSPEYSSVEIYGLSAEVEVPAGIKKVAKGVANKKYKPKKTTSTELRKLVLLKASQAVLDSQKLEESRKEKVEHEVVNVEIKQKCAQRCLSTTVSKAAKPSNGIASRLANFEKTVPGFDNLPVKPIVKAPQEAKLLESKTKATVPEVTKGKALQPKSKPQRDTEGPKEVRSIKFSSEARKAKLMAKLRVLKRKGLIGVPQTDQRYKDHILEEKKAEAKAKSLRFDMHRQKYFATREENARNLKELGETPSQHYTGPHAQYLSEVYGRKIEKAGKNRDLAVTVIEKMIEEADAIPRLDREMTEEEIMTLHDVILFYHGEFQKGEDPQLIRDDHRRILFRSPMISLYYNNEDFQEFEQWLCYEIAEYKLDQV